MEAGHPGGGGHVQVVGPCLLLVQVGGHPDMDFLMTFENSSGMISRLFLCGLAALSPGLMTAA